MDAGICTPGTSSLSSANGAALVIIGRFQMVVGRSAANSGQSRSDDNNCGRGHAPDQLEMRLASPQALESYVTPSSTFNLSSTGTTSIDAHNGAIASRFLTSSLPSAGTAFRPLSYPSSRPSPSNVVSLALLSLRISPPSSISSPLPSIKSSLHSTVSLSRSSPACAPTFSFGSPCHVQGAIPSSVASQTTTSPGIPEKANNFGVHTSSWYIGVIFGTIAGIVLLILLVSIMLCVWRKAVRRRRAQDTVVPWATFTTGFSSPGDEMPGGGFNARSSRGGSPQNAVMNPEDLAYVRAWTPRGDRDVGEPRRAAAPSPFSQHPSMYSLHDHPIPSHGLFAEDSNVTRSKPTSSTRLHPRNTHTLRQLPSHLIDDDLAARAIQEEAGGESTRSRITAAVAGLPTRLRRRSRSDLGEEIADINPYITPPRQQPSMAERLKIVGKREDSWERLPTPGRDQPREDFEPWAASFRANLANAFSVFAAGFGATRNVASNRDPEDNLTAAPIRRSMSSNRKSPIKPSISQRMSSSASMGSISRKYVLHEKGDGAGVVHFLPSLEKFSHHGRAMSRKTGKLSPILSFGGVAEFVASDERIQRPPPPAIRQSLIPLAVSSSPARVVVRPEGPLKRLVPSKQSLLSRNSSYSVYSTSSPH